MGKTPVKVTPDSIALAMDMLATLVAEDLAKQLGISHEQAVAQFLSSRTADMLFNHEETKLWWDGPGAIMDMYLKET